MHFFPYLSLPGRKERRAAERNEIAQNPEAFSRDSRESKTLFAMDTMTNSIVSVPRFKYHERQKNEILQDIFSKPTTPTIVLDCRFESHMTNRELSSLDKQLAICYGSTCRAFSPANIVITGVQPESVTQSNLNKHIGVEKWYWTKTAQNVEDMFAEQKERLVYLTAESENELEELNDNDIYIIGGIVDHNRLKGLTHQIAQEKGLRTARLPIQKYMSSGSRVVLTIVSVFEILLAKKIMGWEDAFKAMLPLRWSWKPVPAQPTDSNLEIDDDSASTTNANLDDIQE